MKFLKYFDYKDKEIELSFEEINRRRNRLKFTVILAAITLVLSALSALSPDWDMIFIESGVASIYTQSKEYPISIFVLDSGSANCVLIHSEEANILVDCGKEKADKNVLETMKIINIDTLDLVILTHPDKDHIGNLEEVAEKIKIRHFITCENGDYNLTENYKNLLLVLEKHNIEAETVKVGDKFCYGLLTLDVVSPIMVYDTSNDNSVVVKVSYMNFSVLLTGDIGKKAENDIVKSGADISAEVLLVPHHGSGSSSTDEFLSAVNPEYAVISVEQNDYLPDNGVLARLVNRGCQIYRTDKQGNIVIVSDGDECKILTEYK